MRPLRRVIPLLIAASIVAAACATEPQATEPATLEPSPTATPAPLVSEAPFVPSAWPAAGTACGLPGYTGRLGRIEAVDSFTVRFTMCDPDGAFPARIAHPALAILDATSIARIADDAGAARSVAGTGPYRIAAWDDDDNVLLERVAGAPGPVAVAPTVVLRWQRDPAQRTEALQDASVDGMDAPGPAELDVIATQPELLVTPRPGIATAFLAFGTGPAFARTGVRRAIASAMDRGALTDAAFPAGSVVPTHVTPCIVPAGCGGRTWYEYNAPAAAASLATASFDLEKTYALHVPDQPVRGLPDPEGAAEAVRAQLEANIGLRTSIDVMPLAEFRDAVDRGALDGLYLDGVSSSLADASGILESLFGSGLRSTPARRAGSVSEALAKLAGITGPQDRAAVIEEANAAIRSAAPLIPIAHPGTVATFRSDVTGVVLSPLGLDPLGAATPGDRPQLVFMQATRPPGAWCADEESHDAIRLCGLVTQSLYGFAPGALAPEPSIAASCDPDEDAVRWTCRLRDDVAFSDGPRLDAGDVLASLVAQWDRTQPLRASNPQLSFGAWAELFGGTLDGS